LTTEFHCGKLKADKRDEMSDNENDNSLSGVEVDFGSGFAFPIIFAFVISFIGFGSVFCWLGFGIKELLVTFLVFICLRVNDTTK
jgi:Na+-driven multidrug efflux pump